MVASDMPYLVEAGEEAGKPVRCRDEDSFTTKVGATPLSAPTMIVDPDSVLPGFPEDDSTIIHASPDSKGFVSRRCNG